MHLTWLQVWAIPLQGRLRPASSVECATRPFVRPHNKAKRMSEQVTFGRQVDEGEAVQRVITNFPTPVCSL